MKAILNLLCMMMLIMSVSGCALGIAAGAGVMAADEFDEAKDCGDDFDPLEGMRGKDDGCN